MKIVSQITTALGIAVAATGIAVTSANADSVTVKSGDTLSSIAESHNTNADILAQLNQLADKNVIFVGQEIALDAESAPVASSVQTATLAAAPTQPVAQATTTSTPIQTTYTTPVTTTQAAPVKAQASVANTNSGSTKEQFLANGGTEALWNSVVMPESGGNPNAVSSNGYRGLGQTKQSWGSGSVADQTHGLVNYATSRYGSVSNAVQFRQANGWW